MSGAWPWLCWMGARGQKVPHQPLRPSVCADGIKELPGTQVLRPFRGVTLAMEPCTRDHDERLADAALPALAIVPVGLLPVVVLSRALRAGGDGLAEAPAEYPFREQRRNDAGPRMRHRPYRIMALSAALSMLLLAACGGGGAGPASANAPVDTQTLPTARAVFDFARASIFLSNDVQNIIVLAPDLVARGSRTEVCDGGGNLVIQVVRGATDPAPLVRQVFNDCRTSGFLIRGQTEISYTLSVGHASDRPWAGSVRFIGYSIEGSGASPRRRAYEGLASGEGRLGAGSMLLTERRMTLADFTLSDSPDTLGRGGLVSTTTAFTVQRTPGLIGDPYTLQGSWVARSAGLTAAVTLDEGSQVSMVQNVGEATARGRITWTDTVVPSFNGSFVMRGSGSTAVRLEMDLGADGSVDRDAVLDRYAQIGVGV